MIDEVKSKEIDKGFQQWFKDREHNFSIRKLNKFSLLHNKAVKVLNKPKDVAQGKTGFGCSSEQRILRGVIYA